MVTGRLFLSPQPVWAQTKPCLHGHVTGNAPNLSCGSVPTWAHAVPGCVETHGTTWRPIACAWTRARPGCAWLRMGPWPHGKSPVGACFHGRMWPCTHDMAWKGMYGLCGSMKACSHTEMAPAIVCRHDVVSGNIRLQKMLA